MKTMVTGGQRGERLTLDFADRSVAEIALESVVSNFDGEAHFIC